MKTLSLAATLAALLHVGAGMSVAQTGFGHDPFLAHQSGGTMLGIYAVETLHGLRVMETVDSCSAHGRLLPNDILLRATADNLPVFSINTHERMEYAKAMIGANRVAAIEFFRPGVGHMYAWMTFELKCSAPHATIYGITQHDSMTFEAEFVLESERPGAQKLFAAPATAAAPATQGAPATAAPVETAPETTPNAAPPADQTQPVEPTTPSEPADENSLDSLFK